MLEVINIFIFLKLNFEIQEKNLNYEFNLGFDKLILIYDIIS